MGLGVIFVTDLGLPAHYGEWRKSVSLTAWLHVPLSLGIVSWSADPSAWLVKWTQTCSQSRLIVSTFCTQLITSVVKTFSVLFDYPRFFLLFLIYIRTSFLNLHQRKSLLFCDPTNFFCNYLKVIRKQKAEIRNKKIKWYRNFCPLISDICWQRPSSEPSEDVEKDPKDCCSCVCHTTVLLWVNTLSFESAGFSVKASLCSFGAHWLFAAAPRGN